LSEFGHRSLRCYIAAIDVVGLAHEATRSVDRSCLAVRDQLMRASTSIGLNIAEGAAEFSTGDKARFYRIARRSAAEAGAAFDVLERLGQVPDATAERANRRLEAIAAMLTRMIHSTRARTTAAPDRSVSVSQKPARETSPRKASGFHSVPQKPAPETSPRNASGFFGS